MTLLTIDEGVKTVVKQLLQAESIEEAFCGFIVHSTESEKNRKDSCLDIVKKFWKTIPQEKHDITLKHYVSCIYEQPNYQRGRLLLCVLESMVESNVISARSICEALLTSPLLNYENSEKWCQTFKLVRRIIGGVDYKGCRDFLRVILEKAQSIPISENVCTVKLIASVCDVVSYVLDRNACLLPSYFAVNEITKFLADGKPPPHWKVGQLLASFVQTFRPAAHMVTVSGRTQLLPVVGHSSVGHSSAGNNFWKLNPNTLRFQLSGPLPYDKELNEPQTALLRYVLEQPYSRDMVCGMLSLNKQMKQRCSVLEEQLVDLVVLAMERSELETGGEENEEPTNQWLWQHLSSQLIFFVLFAFASFPHMVLALYERLKGRNLRKGRDHLMWVLLQFISGSIQKNPLEEFLPMMKLYDLLYPEKESIPVPDVTKASSTHKMAVTCIWIHLCRKATSEKVKLLRPIPHALQRHEEFLRQIVSVKNSPPMVDYKIALLCNAYSTNTDYFALPMGLLVESIYGNGTKTTLLPGNITASLPTQPLPMSMLDSLTVHAKMSLIHSIVTRVMRQAQAQAKTNIALAPALVETYSRLLVYMEIESLGIKGFISQLLPSVFKSNAWGILHTLLEMFSYRLHHIQPHYRVQLLSQLHTLASVPQTNQAQLHLCVESTALRLIMGLGSWEVQPQLSRVFTEPKTLGLLSSESEELNRTLVLTLARAMQVTGSETLSGTWCKDILTTIMQHTPHGWSSHTLACFPPALNDFFTQNAVQKEDKTTLKRNVDTEYRKWKSMASENELIAHFSMSGTPSLFLCVLWKSLLEDNRISPTAYKVIERLGPRALAGHLRIFADYLVYEFSASPTQQVNKCLEALNDLVWRCNVVPIDRLVLCLALRSFQSAEVQVCYFIISQLLLKRSAEFKNRVHDFVKENSPEHWLQNKWHEKHMAFHGKYPEKFFFEDVATQSQHQYLPLYFGNVCIRFLPVFDIVIHRFLELPAAHKTLEQLLDHLGVLYKFHDRPMTYLFNTLHYYEKKLKDKPQMKKKLVNAIVGSLKDIKQPNWCLSEEYLQYLHRSVEDATNWLPEQEYYIKLISRLVDTINGVSPAPFPSCDWRFNEFPNPSAHALHATCIELMALPVTSQTVGTALVDIILKGASQIARDKIVAWMNCIGMVLTALPDGYWQILNDRVTDILKTTPLCSPALDSNPFHMFNFAATHQVVGEVPCSYVLAMCHALWQHASIGQISIIPQFLKEKLKPIVKTEEQFLFVCHLVGPFLQRFHVERTRCLLELTIELYEMLEIVDKSSEHMRFMDPISDFLYHIKYMFVGDGVKAEVEKVICKLRTALQVRLRFISHHSKEESTPP